MRFVSKILSILLILPKGHVTLEVGDGTACREDESCREGEGGDEVAFVHEVLLS